MDGHATLQPMGLATSQSCDLRACSTCGLRICDHEPEAGMWRATIKDEYGIHHSRCWGMLQRNAAKMAMPISSGPSAEHLEMMKLLQQIRDDVRKLCAINLMPFSK